MNEYILRMIIIALTYMLLGYTIAVVMGIADYANGYEEGKQVACNCFGGILP